MTLANNSIFISYRKDDSGGWATRIADDLRAIVGKEAVFIDDSTGIPLGTQWPDQIAMALDQCRIFLPVIAPNWAREPNLGRLKTPADWVRQELLSAYYRKPSVLSIPVFVNDAAALVPDSFSDDAELHKAVISLMNDQGMKLDRNPEHWSSKVDHLVLRIQDHLGVNVPLHEDVEEVCSDLANQNPEKSINRWLNSRQGMLAVLGLAIAGIALWFQIPRTTGDKDTGSSIIMEGNHQNSSGDCSPNINISETDGDMEIEINCNLSSDEKREHGENSLKNALFYLRKLTGLQSYYFLPSLGSYANDPTPQKWILVLKEVEKIEVLIIAARDALFAYESTLPPDDVEPFRNIHKLLASRELVLLYFKNDYGLQRDYRTIDKIRLRLWFENYKKLLEETSMQIRIAYKAVVELENTHNTAKPR